MLHERQGETQTSPKAVVASQDLDLSLSNLASSGFSPCEAAGGVCSHLGFLLGSAAPAASSKG